MNKNKKTAGKTASLLTPEQEERLIENTQQLATVNKILEKVSDKDVAVRFIIFDNGTEQIAVSSEPGREYIRKNACSLETFHDKDVFEILENYFYNKKLDILQEICAVYMEGGEQ